MMKNIQCFKPGHVQICSSLQKGKTRLCHLQPFSAHQHITQPIFKLV